jgi:hypothetical protein
VFFTVWHFVLGKLFGEFTLDQLNKTIVTLGGPSLPVPELMTMMVISLLFITHGMKITKPSLSIYQP